MENNQNVLSVFREPAEIKLAHGYFPFQQLNEVSVSVKALDMGTIFHELSMPYDMDPEFIFEE